MLTARTLPCVILARHCETEWSLSGRHTGLTDLPLTERGQRDAIRLGERLNGMTFDRVMTSPLQRALRTCELTGFADVAQVEHDLVEWDYGRYEGRRTSEIRAECPNWQLFRDGCPGGESPGEVNARADRVVQQLRDTIGRTLLFSSGHFLRVLAARWLGLEPVTCSAYLMLDAGSLSQLGFQRDRLPAIWEWNDTHHLEARS